ncbi:HAD hydrolase-like protein [Brevundimonas sp.]|uniref:HAD hydrolase-like protein n=1 Tax=Brevundimonas sp. TaxID=1871086 RepID=UPI002D5DE131|nr:HAD hydrolase-like protein [Brevundimonas sp.]HYD26776.1 HAD hydrolase-like protein [Brevundimonas sp.]
MSNRPETRRRQGVKPIVTDIPGFTGSAVSRAFAETDRQACQEIAAEAAVTPTYRLVVFDFDGVLADSADWMLRMLPSIIDEFGLTPKKTGELQTLRGSPTREVVRSLGVPAWKIPAIARRLRQMSEGSAGEITVFPGVRELLRSVRTAGVATAIVSSNGEATVRTVLGDEVLGWIDHLDCGVALFGKAARLRKLARRSGVPPRESVYVGDETRDIEAARWSGFASAAVTWGYGTREVLAEHSPTALVETVSDLKLCLGI